MLNWLVDEFLLDLLGHVLEEDHVPIVKQLLNAFKVVLTSLFNFLHCWSRIHLAVDLLDFKKSSYLPLMGMVARIFSKVHRFLSLSSSLMLAMAPMKSE